MYYVQIKEKRHGQPWSKWVNYCSEKSIKKCKAIQSNLTYSEVHIEKCRTRIVKLITVVVK